MSEGKEFVTFRSYAAWPLTTKLGICESCETLKAQLAAVQKERDILKQIASEFHWMARRYADGRQTGAVSNFNEATRKALALGVTLHPCFEQTIWARDGSRNRAFDGLSAEEAAMGRGPDYHHDGLERRVEQAEQRVKELEKEKVEGAKLITQASEILGTDRQLRSALAALLKAAEPFAKLSFLIPDSASDDECYCVGALTRKAKDFRAFASAVQAAQKEGK